MDKSQQLYLFIFSTTTVFADINPKGDFTHSWFDAQNHCLDKGLTIEKGKSDQLYWTGIYRRLTPWINILGCYPDSIESLQYVIKKTLIISSIGMCQEKCHHENIAQFAVKMNNCLCIKHDLRSITINSLPPLHCKYKCENNADDAYLADCGGEDAYNIYETQEVMFHDSDEKRCLSLQCFEDDKRFIPQNCSNNLDRVCANMERPDNEFANSWILSMEHCKNSQSPFYLLGDVNLHDPLLACKLLFPNFNFVWIGVGRERYTSIDQGWGIEYEQRESFLQCQMCAKNYCQFRHCSDTSANSIFCKNISDESKGPTTSKETFSASPGASDELALKISLPVIMIFIILLLCATAVVFYTRRRKMKKADKTTKTPVESGPMKHVDSNVDCVQNNPYFVLEQRPQYISKGSYSSNESPYNNSEEGVYDHLRDKQSRKPEVEDTYQHASAGVSRDMSEYDTMANAVNKKQEEDASYVYSHQDSNGNYACDLRANNHLTDDPYDVAT